MGLKVDAIVSPVLFEEEDTGLVELAIAPEDENKQPLVHTSSDPVDYTHRLGRAIAQWENVDMDFDERFQADPTYIDSVQV